MGYQSNEQRTLRLWRVVTYAALSGLAIVGNVICPKMFRNVSPDDPEVYLSSFLSGGLLAEGCLLGIWCALGTQPIKHRLPITCGLAAFGAWSFVVGLQRADRGLPWQAAVVVVVLSGLAFFCAIQVPLWVLRATRGLRIASIEESEEHGAASSQFGIRYLLGFTTGVAVLLVLVRNSLPEDSSSIGPELPEVVLAILIFVIFATVICLPALGCALGDRWRLFWLSWLVATITIGPPLVVGILFAMLGPGPDFVEITMAVFFLALGTGGTTLSVLWVTDLLGFELVTNDD